MHDLKKEAAKAALSYIKPAQTIGLGAGTTINHVIDLIDQELSFKASLLFITPCVATARRLSNYGLTVIDPSNLKRIDSYFDSCDQVDQQLNAWKSGGGIHTNEKIYASLADAVFLLVDSSKLVPTLNTDFPLCIEVIPAALGRIMEKIETIYQAYGAQVLVRENDKKTGPVRSDNGNFLADVYFQDLPDLAALNSGVKLLPGIVEHSLFYQRVSHTLVAEPTTIRVLTADQ